MCGIAYIVRKDNKPAAKQVYKRYKKQKTRGQDGFGFVAIDKHATVKKVARFQFEHEAERALGFVKEPQILFHHRYPTSTPNLAEMSHPIDVSHPELKYDYLVVHNGVIINADELKDNHEVLGYAYTTLLAQTYTTMSGKVYDGAPMFNDSESFAIELARTIEGLQGVVNAEGPIAYIAIQIHKQNDKAVAVYYGTNGKNPLCVTEQKEFIAIASEGGRHIPGHKCFRLDMVDHTTTEVPEVKLVGHDVVAAPRNYHGSGGMYSSSIDWQDTDAGRLNSRDTAQADVWALECELEDIDSEIALAKEEAVEAIASGDAEAEDTIKYELKSLQSQRARVEALLLTKEIAGEID